MCIVNFDYIVFIKNVKFIIFFLMFAKLESQKT